ncbi:MAG: cation diffusion facilitator family transporter [Desulfobacterales bacterium]|nr:cation diffusion facilitator family transporter [Desulfobacterales bacterium]
MTRADDQTTDGRSESRRIQQVALYALLLNLILAAAKAVMAAYSGSLALTASAIDSGTDAVASLVLLGGLRLSSRKTPKFPLGLYKIENVLSVVVALFIFLAGYEILQEAFSVDAPRPHVSALILGLQAAATLSILIFGRYALKVGRHTGSPTLTAEGRHRQVDALSSLIVLVSLVFAYADVQWAPMGVGIDQAAAVLVLVFIAHTGWELLSDGMRVLLDASIDFETLEQIRKIVEKDPMVAEVKNLVGRNAGRFRFLNIRITVRATDLGKAHQVSDRIEQKIRRRISHVEGVTIHYEPQAAAYRLIAVPLANRQGDISDHFGESPFFAIIKIRNADRRIQEQRVMENPHRQLERGKGLRVAEWLVRQKIDEVRIREEIKHKGPGYVFADAGLRIVRTGAGQLEDVVQEIAARR